MAKTFFETCTVFNMNRALLLQHCHELLCAYKNGLLGDCVMPEESAPKFSAAQTELRIAYFTLPMALNYQRDSYKLWNSALQTYEDNETRNVFDVVAVANMTVEELQRKLMKYKVALQPNKHTQTWQKICVTVYENWGSFSKLFASCDYDFLQLRKVVQQEMKKGFPYLSGPKIFNYWSFILGLYADVSLKYRDEIEIAPDTHVIQCSIKLGVLTTAEAESWSREKISAHWRELLKGSDITPSDVHSPLWFWSRSGFKYQLR